MLSADQTIAGAGDEPLEAIVLAGGLGTRLRPIVADVPKVLAPVAGSPFIVHLLRRLKRAGCTRTVLAVSYLREQIEQAIGLSFEGMTIVYSIEDLPLGTGGAIRQALARSQAGTAIVVNGDTWLEVDYRAMVAAHRVANARVSVAVTAMENVARYGAVDIDAEDRIVRFAEKGEYRPGFINGGVYAVRSTIFQDFYLPTVFSFESDFLARHCSELRPLAFHTAGRFIDIGVPEDYAFAQAMLSARADL